MKFKAFTIKIKKEDLPKMVPRSGVMPSKPHKDKSKYQRKDKHPQKPKTKD